MDVIIHIDEQLGLQVLKNLPSGSTIGELKESLARDDPTGNASRQDFAISRAPLPMVGRPATLGDDVVITQELAELAIVIPSDFDAVVEALALPTEAVEYRVLQRSLIKKLGTDPSGEGAIKINRRVGSIVFASGRTWTGPRGGEWVELDSVVEKPGWLLVEGPGFGMPGPLLRKVVPGEHSPMLLRVEKPVVVRDTESLEHRDILLPSGAKVKDAKEWIALIFGLEPSRLIIGRPSNKAAPARTVPYRSVRSGVLRTPAMPDDAQSLEEVGFKDGDDLPYVYTGDLGKAFEGKEPTWKGKLTANAKPKPAIPEAKGHPELIEHFQVLELQETTAHDDIKRHYRRLALDCHPDKHPDDVASATARFQCIKAAYEAIRDALQL
mmetsp:Transcript_108587/g.242182  ORF Transcript_108587/g.242182 Transcript_108587/m.242182 type:complete len:382 (+) Transcript_108587:49-1194(+)